MKSIIISGHPRKNSNLAVQYSQRPVDRPFGQLCISSILEVGTLFLSLLLSLGLQIYYRDESYDLVYYFEATSMVKFSYLLSLKSVTLTSTNERSKANRDRPWDWVPAANIR